MIEPRYRLYGSISMYFKSFFSIFNSQENDNYISLLELKLSKYLDVKHVIFVNQARIGLYLIATTLFNPTRPKIICSPYTIHDVINMLILAGWHPVFTDIRLDTLNLDLDAVKSKIEKDNLISAVLITHLHGVICDPNPIKEYCASKEVLILEDAAQALGATVHNRHAGTLGMAGVLSFGLMKNVNGLFGGAILTNSDTLAKTIREIQSKWGIISRIKLLRRALQGLTLTIATNPIIFHFITFRLFRYSFINESGPINKLSQSEVSPTLKKSMPNNYLVRPSNTQAKFIVKQFELINTNTSLRQKRAQIYNEAFRYIDNIYKPSKDENINNIYLQFPIAVPDRREFILHILSSNFDCAGQHIKNCANLECFKQYQVSCPNAEYAENHVALLPTYPSYNLKKALKLADISKKYFSSYKNVSNGKK